MTRWERRWFGWLRLGPRPDTASRQGDFGGSLRTANSGLAPGRLHRYLRLGVGPGRPTRVPTPASGSAGAADAPPAAYVRPTYVAWADLLRRVFALDILACPDCGGWLRLLATGVTPVP